MKKTLLTLLLFALFIPIQTVFAETDIIPVLSRGHIENLGDYPADHTWIESPEIIGTVGQSKRIEGFELKPDADVASEIELRYNVHVQNLGWLYDENDPSTWAKNGDYAGTRGKGLRIEAIKIVLLDTTGKQVSGYHVRYHGHVQNIGDLPSASEEWFLDGEQLGTVGSSLRLEALKLEIVKDATTGTDLSAYTALIKQIESLNESDFSKTSWNNLQSVVSQNKIDEQSSSAEITTAIAIIQKAMNQLEDLTQSTIYSKAGSYGPSSGSESINQDVIITTGDVTLQNLTIDGNLIIDEAVGNGNVTLNNVTVSGELRVRGGGKNSIHINGGNYSKILIEQAPDGGVRIVATGLDGVPVVLSENAAGETLILEGSFDSVTVKAPDVVIKTQGQTSIKTLNVEPEAQNTAINLGSTTTVSSLAIASPAMITGTGTINKAEIASDHVSFEKAPENYTVDPEVVVPPVIPEPTPQPGGGGYTPPSKISLSVTTAPTVSLSKTYDGTTATDVTNQLLDAAAITGIAIGDTVTVTATATYDNKNVGSNKDITITYNLSGAAASKYTPPVTTTIKGEIVTKTLSLPTAPILKEFDGTATLNTEITESLGQLAADNLTITRTATYLDNNVGTNKPVTCFYTLSGTDAGNYSAPADHPSTGTITKRTLTVSGASLNINKTKTYDGTTDVFNGKGKIQAGNNAISVATGVAADPTIIVTATAAYDNQNAGDNRIITVSYSIDSTSANNRYQVPATETISDANITARSLTVVAPTPVAKAYDGTADVFTAANNTGIIYNKSVTPGNIAAPDASKVTVTATATYDAGKDVGTDKHITIHYTLSGAAASNYLPLPDDHSKTADITPLMLNTGAVTEKTKEYDGTSTAKVNVNLSCSDNNGVFQAEAGKTLFSKIDSKYYTDNAYQSETSQTGTGLYLKYTISLEGASADNYVFAGGEKTLTATTNGGSITTRKLSVNVEMLRLQTEKDYDGKTRTNVSGATIDKSTGLTGIVGSEMVLANAVSDYAKADAGDHLITTTFYLSGEDAGNYSIDPLTSSGKIKPIQLAVDSTKLPAIAATRKYDATTDVYLAANTSKLLDYPLDAGAVSGLIGSEAVTVKATASYNDKNIGENKAITITYSLGGDAAKNYLAPAPDTSKSAAITPRILGYANVNLITMKKADGSSSVSFINTPNADSTTYGGMDGIARIDGTNTQENVYLGSYSANYYNGSSETSDVGSNYDIKLSGTLAGADADNYLMTDYTYSQKGQILADNAVISTPYDSNNWAVAGTLTPPAAGFKLFYVKQAGSMTYYGYDSGGQIYSSTNLSSWTNVNQVTLDGKQLIGFDSDSSELLAIPNTPTTDGYGNTSYLLYYWSGGNWCESAYTIINIEPVNPTYYGTATNDYLIYQDADKNVIKRGFNDATNETIGSSSFLSLPSGFNNSLLVYDGSNLMRYAY
ncbi:YDG domain-containing protein [Acetobacterium wieringae]|uniref:Clostridial hydrophobic W n=1 Tax=Acetobacterium wieringae TaxID=52694 RepID=A0A1F2PLS5_9FIRM|nr:YDG domain-containing protein [Acetobacterium wieringae]OFV72353.1 clostridial hydrophobic W [Acetobacterium wieringae]